MSKWLNTTKRIHKPNEESNFGKDKEGKDLLWTMEKPCHSCGFCPYGQLVEEYPLQGEKRDEVSCKVFGHDCPAYYMAEPLSEKD